MRSKLFSGARHQQLQEFQGQSGQAIRRVQSRRLRDWRCDSVLSGREQIQSRRPPVRHQLGPVQRRDGRLRGDGRTRRAVRRQPGHAQVLPVPGAGPERAQGDGEGAGQAGARHPVLQHERHHRSRAARSTPCVTAWSGSRDGSCLARGSTATQVRDAIVSRRSGVRDSAGGRADLPDQLPRIGLDSLAACPRSTWATR